MERFIKENPVSLANSGIILDMRMRLSAIVGKKGCIETEVSGAALHRILLEHINNGENSIISNTKKNLEDLTLDDIIDAVNKEDLLCIELVEEIGVKLGRHVAGLMSFSSHYWWCIVTYR